jgi:hypothetical protein
MKSDLVAVTAATPSCPGRGKGLFTCASTTAFCAGAVSFQVEPDLVAGNRSIGRLVKGDVLESDGVIDPEWALKSDFTVGKKDQVRSIFLGRSVGIELHGEFFTANRKGQRFWHPAFSKRDLVHPFSFGNVHKSFKAEKRSGNASEQDQENAEMNEIDAEMGELPFSTK